MPACFQFFQRALVDAGVGGKNKEKVLIEWLRIKLQSFTKLNIKD
jgi:hypothetical protein